MSFIADAVMDVGESVVDNVLQPTADTVIDPVFEKVVSPVLDNTVGKVVDEVIEPVSDAAFDFLEEHGVSLAMMAFGNLVVGPMLSAGSTVMSAEQVAQLAAGGFSEAQIGAWVADAGYTMGAAGSTTVAGMTAVEQGVVRGAIQSGLSGQNPLIGAVTGGVGSYVNPQIAGLGESLTGNSTAGSIIDHTLAGAVSGGVNAGVTGNSALEGIISGGTSSLITSGVRAGIDSGLDVLGSIVNPTPAAPQMLTSQQVSDLSAYPEALQQYNLVGMVAPLDQPLANFIISESGGAAPAAASYTGSDYTSPMVEQIAPTSSLTAGVMAPDTLGTPTTTPTPFGAISEGLQMLTQEQLSGLSAHPEAVASYKEAGLIPEELLAQADFITSQSGGEAPWWQVAGNAVGGSGIVQNAAGAGISSLIGSGVQGLLGAGIQGLVGAGGAALANALPGGGPPGQTKTGLAAQNSADPFARYRPQYAAELNSLMQNPSSVQNLPGYAEEMAQGTQAEQRGMAATGQTQSGQEQIALDAFGRQYQRGAFQDQYNRLSQLSGASQSPYNAAAFGQNAGQARQEANAGFFGAALRSPIGTALQTGVGNAITGGLNSLFSNPTPTQSNVGSYDYGFGSGSGPVTSSWGDGTENWFSQPNAGYDTGAGGSGYFVNPGQQQDMLNEQWS